MLMLHWSGIDFHIFVMEGVENIAVSSALLALAVGMSWKMEAGHLQSQENLTNQMECVCQM